MSTTLNLPYKRFVAQVSTGAPRSKSTYLSLMAENLEALKVCPWREATDVPVALVDHDFTAASHFSDAYDAFKMTGAWDVRTQNEVAFAGMAAYRFTIPSGASNIAISSITLPISRDRFLKGGVHVAVVLSDSASPSLDWATVTGDGADAYLVNAAAYLVASQPADGALTITSADLASLAVTGKTYLWIYLTLEDYTDHWEMYDAKEKRLYAIEGSAMLVGGSTAVTFAGDVTPDSAGTVTLLPGGSSPTWLQPLPTVNAGVDAPPVPTGSLIERFFAAQSKKVAQQYVRTVGFRTTGWEGIVTLNYLGNVCTGGTVAYKDISTGTAHTGVLTAYNTYQSSTFQPDWNFISPEYVSINGYVGYLYVNIRNSAVQMASDGFLAITNPYIVAYDNNVAGAAAHRVTGTDKTEGSFGSQNDVAYIVDNYYVMLEFTDGVPSDAGHCNAQDVGSKRDLLVDIAGSESPWTVTIGINTAYTVTKSGDSITLKLGSTTIKTWTSFFGADTDFFDAAVSLHLSNTNVSAYGLASVLGDFSHAVATFEQGSQPSDTELLGRLARMSRKDAGQMLYLHPENGALADELDVLRPVPRFWRTAADPTGQGHNTCQPGLSVWYRRPTSSSEAAFATGYNDDGTVISVTKVTNPVFLQLTGLAVRAPSAFSARLVLGNKTGAITDGPAVANHFNLRFVAWRSPAGQWDGSNAFAMAAMASMPSIYRSDGDGSVAWSVDCTGSLLRFGTRTMTAERIGVSQVVAGEIAAGALIEIPLVTPVDEGDVVLIAPEVLAFAPNVTNTASKWFGRATDPASATDTGKGWARYAHNLGWFPRVTGI